jgi:dihydroxyacetone kinase-like predicted kinase
MRLNREALNRINVFPVPDGDTGNNLLHTLESALLEAQRAAGLNLGAVVEAASRGAHHGSCGSSGAIFAQFLKGWAVILAQIDRAGVDNLAKAFKEGAKKAYSAVVRPVEGTILTVARKAAEGAQLASAGGDMVETLLGVYHQGLQALNSTPRMLEALGTRGVVDAGGWGLLLFLSSLLKAMGVPVDQDQMNFDPVIDPVWKKDDYEFSQAYDLEFSIFDPRADVEKKVRELLHKSGSEIITRTAPGRCRVHIHTDRPLLVLEKAGILAPLQDLVIRDMRKQFQSMKEQQTGALNYTVIALGASPGFLALFAMAGAEAAVSLEADGIINRLLREFKGSDTLILSPGGEGSYNVPVIDLKEEVRVLAALLSMYSARKLSVAEIYRAAFYPRTARITGSGSSYSASNDHPAGAPGKLREVLVRAVAALEPMKGEVLSLFYGRHERRTLIEKNIPPLLKEFHFLDIEIHYGGQDFPLVLAVE